MSREFLQYRPAAFTLTIVSLYAIVSAVVLVFYELGHQAKPQHYAVAVAADLAGGVILLAIGQLLRRRVFSSARSLLALDIACLVAVAMVGAVIAYSTSDRRMNDYLTLTLYAFIVIARALFVPSTRRRCWGSARWSHPM